MKRSFLAIMILFSFFASCKKFLEERQVANLTQDYYNNESGLEALISGLYVYARVKHEWDASGARLTETETDAYQTANTLFATMSAASYGSDVSTIATNVNNYLGSANSNYAPMGAYPHINNCNIALDIIDNTKPGKFGTDDAFRRARRAEILFLRSWAYYLVSNQLGDVPLLLTPRREDNGIYNYPKARLEDIYKQIISDVRYAYENLPVTTVRGRASKLAAGHFLAKLYLNRAQAAPFQNSGEVHLKMLYKGSVATDLDSSIAIATEVINAAGGVGGLAPDYWMLFDPKTSETTPHREVLFAAQFDVNTTLNGRFGGNRSVNYHIGDYTSATGVTRVMAYGRPFGIFKPTDWGYDNFRDKVNDSRYYKTFQYEYISNATGSFTWNAGAAAWWNANRPTGEPAVVVGAPRATSGRRALIYLENDITEALDSTRVMSQPYQFMVRWIRSAVTGRLYYRLWYNGENMGLNTGRTAPYLSSKKYTDPLRGGSADESNFNSEAGTRDAILMRLAETYLIRAEAYGRKGQYAQAVSDINVLRERAAYKSGEQRPNVLVEWEPKATTLTAAERTPPYSALNSFSRIMATENHFTPGTPEAVAEGYIPTVTSKQDMFIHFIYNEKAREFLSEGLQWEDLHNAGILYERVVYLNQTASPLTGLWPVAFNTANGNGQNGNGKGQMRKEYTFRPWPNAYLVQLTDETGNPLDAAARKAYQNPGY
ncbi:RagB/SusD family nutrient uptake outer membrane protein [Segetibacter sp. 3557_3]|uniref:RagB/SusD family nutrient uptake outer membrane protein n=1 Tax=Segetibacter sp. 3557_3 TaxID=2547429 RepID=UPI001058E13E|nr:RagB/SusD family nutrient uptake outer membrane protein [Segetibacter sp. 3557_3]TDH23539.1 RagB/SusD family nutrient uptake outer membrane protein [Segetibacter sp. 3557_3]